MRQATTTKLERLFAVIVSLSVPAAGAAVGLACGGSTSAGPAAEPDGGVGSSGGGSSSSGGSSGSSSGAGSSSGSSSGAASSSGGSSSGSSGGSSSGVVCGGCNCGPLDVTLDGGLPDGAPLDGGELGTIACETICNHTTGSCWVTNAGPPVTVQCQVLCLGRRPEGFGGGGGCGRTALGAYFARSAQLEAASVPAFRRMARELARHGAPRKLVKAAERAAREERRHARGAAALAKRFGARAASFEAGARGARSLEDVAIENAVEGCVRETYGALVAAWQARAAKDPQVKAHMTRIAKEETSHAALAWNADAWARARLEPAARRRVEAARREAARALIDEVATSEIAASVARFAGQPDAKTAACLAIELARRVS